MGIKDFSKVFTHIREVNFSDMKGETIAIDASFELYRSCLAGQFGTMTDSKGSPTMYINTLLCQILELKKNNIGQIWVFDVKTDNYEDFNLKLKAECLAVRRERRHAAEEKIQQLSSQLKEITYHSIFVDDLGDTDDTPTDSADISAVPSQTPSQAPSQTSTVDIQDDINPPEWIDDTANPDDTQYSTDVKEPGKSIADRSIADKAITNKATTEMDELTIMEKIQKISKQAFVISDDMVNSLKFMLDCFGIRHVTSPAGYEAEQYAAYLCYTGAVDAVYSGDTDPLAFGATTLYRKNTRDKKIYKYTLADIHRQIADNIDLSTTKFSTLDTELQTKVLHELFIKCAVVLGCDFCKKTPRVGPKSIFKKVREIVLTSEQKKAADFYKLPIATPSDIYNLDREPFQIDKIYDLLEWLRHKNFNISRVLNIFKKASICITEAELNSMPG